MNNQSLESYEQEIIRELQSDIHLANPVNDAYEIVRFLSTKNRRYPKEICLVHDKYSNRFTSWHLFPFDEIASELLDCEDSEIVFIETLLEGSSEPDR